MFAVSQQAAVADAAGWDTRHTRTQAASQLARQGLLSRHGQQPAYLLRLAQPHNQLAAGGPQRGPQIRHRLLQKGGAEGACSAEAAGWRRGRGEWVKSNREGGSAQ